ncbi:hypothetical protein [Thiohalocapsa marina]|uniref:hypothetical protein n=1 Tax=Thiohalocapsa marina TaxID=424902 RepID=UPI0036DACA42
MDLCLRYREVILGIEIKVWRPGAQDPLQEGLSQLDAYLAGLDQNTGWLVIFDRRPDLAPLAERLSQSDALSPDGRMVRVVRV